MTLTPYFTASLIVQIHVIAAVCAVLLGPLALWRRSRDRWHKRLGYAWVLAMFVTAVSSFAIMEIRVIGPFSPIHALSVFSLWSLWHGINDARQRRIKAHQQRMKSLYFWALGVAGLFTFLPGRVLNRVFFAQAPVAGFVALACVIGGGLIWYAYQTRQRSLA